ncbi:MAG: hypothetical protein MI861_24065, partial [Pirellulales bacterium]|nr:hypothetical protein [Pirellulales bacterium]
KTVNHGSTVDKLSPKKKKIVFKQNLENDNADSDDDDDSDDDSNVEPQFKVQNARDKVSENDIVYVSDDDGDDDSNMNNSLPNSFSSKHNVVSDDDDDDDYDDDDDGNDTDTSDITYKSPTFNLLDLNDENDNSSSQS